MNFQEAVEKIERECRKELLQQVSELCEEDEEFRELLIKLTENLKK